MPRLKAANNARTTLAQAVSNSDATIYVKDITPFPSPPFRITVDNEIMEVTAIDTNNKAFTVLRAQEGTIATTHSIGATVENRFTAGTYNELLDATGNAATATKLQTARTISLTGDATGSTTFDGSADKSITVTLANSGVTAGTYTKVTVDSKGRVTSGASATPADIGAAPSSHTHTRSNITDFAHKSTHATGGADALTPADIGAATQDALDMHLSTSIQNGVHEISTAADITLYVNNATGNDSNPGTQTQPLKTIQAAINRIPHIVDHTVTINVSPGTYSNFVIYNKIGKGKIQIIGSADLANSNNYVINATKSPTVQFVYCFCNILLQGFKVNMLSEDWAVGIEAQQSVYVEVKYCKVDGLSNTSGNRTGITSLYNSFIRINNCDISNVLGSGNYTGAIGAFIFGNLYSENNTGSNNSVGLRAFLRGTIIKYSTQPSGTIAESTAAGGQIIQG